MVAELTRELGEVSLDLRYHKVQFPSIQSSWHSCSRMIWNIAVKSDFRNESLARKQRSTHVPGQYYGYSLQCTHCTSKLLAAKPGSTVSIEVLDDVAVQSPEGDVDAVQIKSGLETNPISNRSVDFWKTIRNWVDAVDANTLAVGKTLFTLHIEAPRAGVICKRFSSATSLSDASSAIDFAREELWGKAPKFSKKDKVGGSLAEHLDVVFSTASRPSLEKIIVGFQLSVGARAAYESLLDQTKQLLVDADIAEDVLLHGLGWVKKTLDNLIEKGQPPAIAVDEFRTELNSFRNSLKKRDYLPTFAGLPPSPDEVVENVLRPYVRQLNLVDWSEDALLTAISQFLNTKVNIIQYAKRGYVNRKSLLEFEAALKALWQNIRDEVGLTGPDDAKKRGKLLALKCLKERRLLEGFALPDDFTPGSFHLLADALDIGWHVDYLKLLQEAE